MPHPSGGGEHPVLRGRTGLARSRRMTWRVTRRALAAALSLPCVLVAGCGSQPSRPAAATPPSPAAVVDASRLRLPLDRYLLSPDQSELVARAHRTVLAECMHRFGVAGPPRPPRPDGPRTWEERRYGITDLDLASRTGYRTSTRPPAPVTRPSGLDDPQTLAVLTGRGDRVIGGRPVPPGGCAGETRRRLTAGAPTSVEETDLPQWLGRDTYLTSRRDRRVQAAQRAWSTCMREHGYHYATALDAPADPRFKGLPVSALEITTARTDIACKRRTDLVGVWFAVEADLQRASIATHRDALERIRLTNEAQLRAADGLHLD
ncbi:conserved hypothetical protein [Frankia canadensis]|uniref:Uncharacterized protein n=1 Tax=Frankia canadensis TaxID=1836972 RepID=A0A2I2KIW8_9ACTN|nr:hypothetical protein [Frankia canadensis]SNQ45604.1 conserved hypothetical protein [Frankia canadensis]SOU52894.1 conserved hypothetical protein [Frankia canadensis]